MRTGHSDDYVQFLRQQSDVAMLRLFDSFTESAPQLVFHLFVMVDKEDEWAWTQATWTALSAITSMVNKIFMSPSQSLIMAFYRCLWGGVSPRTAPPCA